MAEPLIYTSLTDIKNWFKTGQFWASLGSFWHKSELLPSSSIRGLDELLLQKADKEVLDTHLGGGDAHADLFDEKVDKVVGLGLSSNDFTDTLLDKLNALGSGGKFVDGVDPLDAVYFDGNVGIGKEPTEKLDVDGVVQGRHFNIDYDYNNTRYGWNALVNTEWHETGDDFSFHQGARNVAIGYEALREATIGDWNTAIGYNALKNNTEGRINDAFGAGSLGASVLGAYNVSLGAFALSRGSSPMSNVAIGNSALMRNNGQYNIGIGYRVAINNTEGSNNVFIGENSGLDNLGSGNVFLGNRSGYYETGNDKLYIHNDKVTHPLIWGDFSNKALKFNINNLNINTLPTDATGLIDGDIYTIDYSHLGEIPEEHRVLIMVKTAKK